MQDHRSKSSTCDSFGNRVTVSLLENRGSVTDSDVRTASSRTITIADVAEAAGVSTATVSYALNPRDGRVIARSTLERIRKTAVDLGYRPNASASALRKGHSDVFLVARDPTFVGAVSERSDRAIRTTALQSGYAPLFYETRTPEDLLAVASATKPAAVLVMGDCSSETELALHAVGVPRVIPLMQSPPGKEPDRPWEEAIGALQVQHLVSRGVESIICVQPESSVRAPVAAARLQGSIDECLRIGQAPPKVVYHGSDAGDLAERLAPLVVTNGPVGIAAWDDLAGLMVLACAHDRGWQTGVDVRVIGADGQIETQYSRPALTTVRYDDNAYLGLANDLLDLLEDDRDRLDLSLIHI